MEETANTVPYDDILRRIARLWSAAIIITTLFVVFQNLQEPIQYISEDTTLTSVVTLTLIVSVVGLALAWRWELAGALINLGFFLLSVILYWIINGEFLRFSSLALMSLLIVPGILFLIVSRQEKTV